MSQVHRVPAALVPRGNDQPASSLSQRWAARNTLLDDAKGKQIRTEHTTHYNATTYIRASYRVCQPKRSNLWSNKAMDLHISGPKPPVSRIDWTLNIATSRASSGIRAWAIPIRIPANYACSSARRLVNSQTHILIWTQDWPGHC